jgi:EIX receptor 1/2
MSDVGISDTIPNWFWDLSSNIQFLNLSHNQITGTIPLQWFSSRFIGFPTIDLSYNCFNGSLPQLNSGSTVLNLSNNFFLGSITSICETNRSMTYKHLNYLDLSDNLLSGELSSCWKNMPNLMVLNLANNNLSGRIFYSIGGICDYGGTPRTLHLQNNSFIGELPQSLMNCSKRNLKPKINKMKNNKIREIRDFTWFGR